VILWNCLVVGELSCFPKRFSLTVADSIKSIAESSIIIEIIIFAKLLLKIIAENFNIFLLFFFVFVFVY
jgi:hypothetical protein